jgi:hypothetical protein
MDKEDSENKPNKPKKEKGEGKWEKLKKKFNIPKKKVWKWVWETIKDPLTLLLFAFFWLCLSSPAIFGAIAYWATGKEKWLILSMSWIAFSAPPLPLPVTPLSIIGAIAFRQVIRKAVAKHKAKKEGKDQDFKPKKVTVEPLQEKVIPPEKALVEIVDIYNAGGAIASDEDLISDESYSTQIHNVQVLEETNRQNLEAQKKEEASIIEEQAEVDSSFLKLNQKRVMSTIEETPSSLIESQESVIKLNPLIKQNKPFQNEVPPKKTTNTQQSAITLNSGTTQNEPYEEAEKPKENIETVSLEDEILLDTNLLFEENNTEINPGYKLNIDKEEKFQVVTFEKIQEETEHK